MPTPQRNPGPVVRAARAGDETRLAELAGQLGYACTPAQMRIRLAALLANAEHAVFAADLPGTELAGWVHVFLHLVPEADLRAEIGGLWWTPPAAGGVWGAP